MNDYISRIENGEYELVIRCNKYEDFKSFESLIKDEMARISNQNPEPDKICGAENSCIGKNFAACLDKFKSEWQSALEKIFKEPETEKECCEMQYADIYGMFDNIIAWLEKFYLGDNCYFIVNRTGATFHRDGGLTILPESFRKRIYPKDSKTDKKETK